MRPDPICERAADGRVTTIPNDGSHRRLTAMATEKQREAARKNIKKAQAAAAEKRTISHLPKSTRTALGKQGAKVAKEKRGD